MFLPLAASGSIALAILGIGFLIFVHELGHFLACRLTRTRVETFSIGFGTRLFGWENLPGEPKRLTFGRRRLDPVDHAMDFRVALVPLGGYVKMAGENLGDDRTGAEDEFPSKPMLARVFIISAGVIMNVITAFVLYLVAYAAHIEQEPAMIGAVERGGPAWVAKLQPGDRIESIAGQRTRSWIELKMETVFLPRDQPAKAVMQRGDEQREIELIPRFDDKVGAVMLEIRPPRTLAIGEGEAEFEIGPQTDVVIDGVPARGGVDAVRALDHALSGDAEYRAEVRLPSGETHELVFEPKAPTADDLRMFKVGVEPWGIPEVKAVRGEAAAVLRPGDQIVAALRGEERYVLDSQPRLDRLPLRTPIDELEVLRGGETLRLSVPGADPAELRHWLDDVHYRVEHTAAARPLVKGEIVPGEDGHFYRYPSVPSEAAGLQVGDVFLSIEKDGKTHPIASWADILRIVSSVREPNPIRVEVRGQDGETRSLDVTPVLLERLHGPALAEKEYWEPYQSEGLHDAAAVAFARTGREIQNVFRLIGAFFSGRLSFSKNIGGPVTIVKVSSSAAQRNWLHFLAFLAYISVTLAVLNILPIPILDGGHLMFILIERVKGSPLKEATLSKLQLVGLMMLLVLMFFAFKNDFLLVTR